MYTAWSVPARDSAPRHVPATFTRSPALAASTACCTADASSLPKVAPVPATCAWHGYTVTATAASARSCVGVITSLDATTAVLVKSVPCSTCAPTLPVTVIEPPAPGARFATCHVYVTSPVGVMIAPPAV